MQLPNRHELPQGNQQKNNKKHMHDQKKYDATDIYKKYQHKLHNTYN